MNFLLRNLESHLDEGTLLEAEALFEAGAVKGLRELERHLWLASVVDDSQGHSPEVEVKLSPSRVLAGSCECATFRRDGECPHFGAVLLALRRELERRQAEKPPAPRKAPAEVPRKLTTAIVLENVDHDELVAFVREYARRHRPFAIALKARFTSNVDTLDNKEKFIQLLDSTISHVRRPDRSVNQRGLQKIFKVLQEMTGQREEALARSHYATAFAIIQSVLERITPLLGKVRPSAEKLEAEIHGAFAALLRVAKASLPPALRQAIWSYLLGEYTKLVYRNYGLDLLFLQILSEMADDPGEVDQVLDALREQQEKYRLEQRPATPLLLLEWQLLEHSGREAAARHLVRQHLHQPDILCPAIEYALQQGDTERAAQLARSGLETCPEKMAVLRLKDYLMEVAQREGDSLTLTGLLEERFLTTLDPRVYQRLRDLVPTADWEASRNALVGQLRQLPPGPARRDALALLLSEEKDPERLLAYLRDTRSLDLLQRYDRQLLPRFSEELLKLYHEWLMEFIQNHLGPKSSRRIREVLDHLNEIGMRDLAARLVQEFRDNYPERHTLMEELSLF